MRPRPLLVSLALLTLALVHAWWGLRMLLASNTFVAGSQLASAGAFLLAAVSVASPRSFGFALTLAGGAIALRVPVVASDGIGPFALATLLLAAGFGLAGWAQMRIADGRAAWEPLALRGGFALGAIAYAAFVGAGLAAGNAPGPGLADFAARILACVLAALYVDAPRPSAAASAGSTSPVARS